MGRFVWYTSRKVQQILLFLILVVTLLSSPGLADFTGKVVGITDGDTFSVLHDGKAEKIRVNGVDCPEIGQPFGTKAKQFASDLIYGQVVFVKTYGMDRYGRTLGDAVLDDGRSLSKELVRSGNAWWYRQYSTDKELEALEEEAKSSHRGLWGDPLPVAPWDWRNGIFIRSSLPKTNAETGTDVSTNAITTAAGTDKDDTVYVTKTGSKYHRLGCRYLKSMIPIPLSEAVKRYQPCSVCNPPIPNNVAANSPQPKSSSASPRPTTNEAGKETVYVTKTGAKYHRAGCRYLKSSAIPVSLEEAASRYQPCSVCSPPVLQATQSDEMPISSGNNPTNVTPAQPQSQPSAVGTPTSEKTATGLKIYTGPRGGKYHISKSGKKVYEKKKKR